MEKKNRSLLFLTVVAALSWSQAAQSQETVAAVRLQKAESRIVFTKGTRSIEPAVASVKLVKTIVKSATKALSSTLEQSTSSSSDPFTADGTQTQSPTCSQQVLEACLRTAFQAAAFENATALIEHHLDQIEKNGVTDIYVAENAQKSTALVNQVISSCTSLN